MDGAILGCFCLLTVVELSFSLCFYWTWGFYSVLRDIVESFAQKTCPGTSCTAASLLFCARSVLTWLFCLKCQCTEHFKCRWKIHHCVGEKMDIAERIKGNLTVNKKWLLKCLIWEFIIQCQRCNTNIGRAAHTIMWELLVIYSMFVTLKKGPSYTAACY